MAKRDYYFDNAKFILIFLVVFGHLIQSYIDSNLFFSTLYKLLYTFHMPAFILVSGFFAKGIYEKGYIVKITKKLIIPYLIFQVIYSIFYFILYSKSMLTIDFFNPHWSLWFLISLFCWNIMLIGFNKLKPIYAISLALLLGLIVGYVDWISNFLSLSRTFVFFPFFIVGYYLKKEHFQLLSESRSRILMTGAIFIVALVIIIFPELDEKWLLGSKPYSYLETFSAIGFIKRIGVYTINFLMIAVFFAFIPKRKFFFTKLGRNTLYVYLLHGFIVRAFRESTIESYVYDSKTFIILLFVSLLLTFLLSSKIVTTVMQPIIELKWSGWKKTLDRIKESISEPRGQSE
ncbi:acyltransferase family protein [Bacillus sp. FJAT-49732]|uniref:Acyltransferase family protein n=1 Tax=Lederbergia citrisecunda TaxID=2833583 RepID=A0A942TJG3_9BACI|nr:acyltransferase family protein [Lederbergia citrisecunda]MBS4198745.1 acyltransferase family protein [Lederbergia citrisecunda]